MDIKVGDRFISKKGNVFEIARIYEYSKIPYLVEFMKKDSEFEENHEAVLKYFKYQYKHSGCFAWMAIDSILECTLMEKFPEFGDICDKLIDKYERVHSKD